MSLSPEDKAWLSTMINTTVNTVVKREIPLAVQPLQDQIDRLEGVDKRHDERLRTHSGTHRDIALNVRKSITEVKETTNADLLAATHHLSSEIETYRKEMNDKLAFVHDKVNDVQTQVAALKTVPAQATASANAAIDTKTEVQKGNNASRNRGIAAIVAFVIIQLIEHFAK